MNNHIIEVNNLSKQYHLGAKERTNRTLREAVTDAFTAPVRNFRNLRRLTKVEDNNPDTIWALKDISFQVQPGEVVGIIGRNGAGKSTLLKILSRITEPTSGDIKLHGRVASLLEVGTGFHPELTGRENIYLNGTILGMRKAEIDSKFDAIVDFSEIEKFLDTPVKRYSSGMYVRLAFAVAAHLEPEILLVDEVLAVGDSEFQKKCLGKMDEVAEAGRTVLFVSHNLAAVKRICKTGIFLESGMVAFRDTIDKALLAYQSAQELRTSSEHHSALTSSLKPGAARFVAWKLIGSAPEMQHSCFSRDVCKFSFNIFSKSTIPDTYIGFALWDSSEQLIMAASSADSHNQDFVIKEGNNSMEMEVQLPLKPGIYNIDMSLNSRSSGQVDRWFAVPNLTVLSNYDSHLPEKWHGLVNEPVHFHLCTLSNEETRRE
jgi:lipopolysaccharide transport system ATP-binding protein